MLMTSLTKEEIRDIRIATGSVEFDQLPGEYSTDPTEVPIPKSWKIDTWDSIAKLGFNNDTSVGVITGRYNYPTYDPITYDSITNKHTGWQLADTHFRADPSNNAQYSGYSDRVTMGRILLSSNAVAEHEYRHKGFKFLGDMLREDPKWFKRHYGKGAYDIVVRAMRQADIDEAEKDTEMLDNRDELILAPVPRFSKEKSSEYSVKRTDKGYVEFLESKPTKEEIEKIPKWQKTDWGTHHAPLLPKTIEYHKVPFSEHGQGDIELQRSFDRYKSLGDNIGQKTLFPRKEQKLFESYEILEVAAQNMIDKRNKDREKKNTTTKGYNSGGGVPRADETNTVVEKTEPSFIESLVGPRGRMIKKQVGDFFSSEEEEEPTKEIDPLTFDKVVDFFSRERGLERSEKLEDAIRYYLGPYAGSLGQANQLFNPIVGLQDASEAAREGRIMDAVTDTAAAALPIAGAVTAKTLARGVQSRIDEAVDAITELMTGKSAGAVDLSKRKFVTEAPIIVAGAGAASSEAVSKGIGEVLSPLLKRGTPFVKGLKNYNSLKAQQEILRKKMAAIMRPSNIAKDFGEQGRLVGFREIQRSMSDNIGELEKTFITEIAPYIDKEVLTELDNAELENLTEEFKSFNSGNLLRLLDPSIPTRSSDGKPLPKIKEVSNKMLDVREELLKRIQTTDNKSDWNIKAKTNAHKLIKEAFTIQNPRTQLDETSLMFDVAEENNLVKYSVDKDQKVSRELITGPELDQILEDYGLDKNGRLIDEEFFDEEFNKGGVVKKFNHGGDVPHADRPYLNRKAENIVKEFNKPNDEFLDTAIDLATEPLQEAKQIFMKAGKGAVFEMLPKDDPRVYQAFRQTNDYLAGLGYAGWKTGEAAAKFVAGSIADALGQDKGEIGYQILRDEKTAARDILGAGEAFAGMVGPRSIQIMDDAIDAFGGYFQLLKTAGPVIKADLGGKLQALADGDFDFLKESSTPKTVGTGSQVTGRGILPVDQPDPKSLTTPKSLVSPLFKTARPSNLTTYPDYGDKNPFYSSLVTAIENLKIGKKGIKGSNVIKYLTKNAPNINMRELYWSGILENAPLRGTLDPQGVGFDDSFYGIDPDKIYTKEYLGRLVDSAAPQIGVRKYSSLDSNNRPRWRGEQQVPMSIFTKEPVLPALPTPPSILNRPNTNRQQTFNIGRGNYEGGQSPGSEYVEYLITNVNPRGSIYPKSDAHWGNKVDGKNENILSHVRGSFVPIIARELVRIIGRDGIGKVDTSYTTRNVFVVDEIQADPAQIGQYETDKTSKVASQRTSKETAKIANTPAMDVKKLFSENLIKTVDDIGHNEAIPTSDRFNRMFNVDENNPFPVQIANVNDGLERIVNELIDAEKDFLANVIDKDEVAQRLYEFFDKKLKTTAILRHTSGPYGLPETIMNQIKLNVLGDLIYGKGMVRTNNILKTKLEKAITNSIGGKPQEPTDITPVGTGDSVRLGLLAIMREAVKKDTNTIVIPPITDLMKVHSLKEGPTMETYEAAMGKALRILRSETNKKVSFKKGKIKGLQFDSDENYLIINFDSNIVDETKQTRFAEGGLV